MTLKSCVMKSMAPLGSVEPKTVLKVAVQPTSATEHFFH